jgi:alpha-beta hydrolase superfamily lysophospholipase
MIHNELHWSASDKLDIYAQDWRPDGELVAAVALVHGHNDHSGRFAHVAQALCDAGYALLAPDLRGNGRSGGPRGHSPSWEQLLDDVQQLLAETARRYPGKPLFLYGHSLGGALVLNGVLRRRPAVAGVIVTSPLLRTAFKPPAWKQTMGRTLYALAPGFSVPAGLNANDLSRDPEIARAYTTDPLLHDRISARLGLDFQLQGEWSIEHAGEWGAQPPLLLVHGTADHITSFDASQEFARRAGAACTFRAWDAGYHELQNDIEKDLVLALIVEWLRAHT